METQYKLNPLNKSDGVLLFSWDKENGIVGGRAADHILRMARRVRIPLHPPSASWELGSTPLKDDVDMAVIVGCLHELPAAMLPFYPRLEIDVPDDPCVRTLD